jgi:hypothetical protein
MELVTLAHVTLHRVGSASGQSFRENMEVSMTREVLDGSVESVRSAVLVIAAESGEQRVPLEALHQVSRLLEYTAQPNTVVFDVLTADIFFSTPYATCYTFPALKINGRYFRLQEVDCT